MFLQIMEIRRGAVAAQVIDDPDAEDVPDRVTTAVDALKRHLGMENQPNELL